MVAPKISPLLGFLRELEVLSPVDLEGLRVFGLRRDAWHRRAPRLVHLREALPTGKVMLRLVDTHTGPPSIWVMNQGDRCLLLPAGEPLPGFLPLRALRVSLVVEARETLRIPAELVEEVQDPVQSGARFPAALRDATGAVFCRGSSVLGLHLFERKESLRLAWPALLHRLGSQAVPLRPAAPEGAVAGEGPPGGAGSLGRAGPIEKEGVAAWLEGNSACRVQVRPLPGLGQELVILDRGLRGRCLMLEGIPLHAEIQAEASAPMSDPSADPWFAGGRARPVWSPDDVSNRKRGGP